MNYYHSKMLYIDMYQWDENSKDNNFTMVKKKDYKRKDVMFYIDKTYFM